MTEETDEAMRFMLARALILELTVNRHMAKKMVDGWLDEVRAEAWHEGYGRGRDDQEAETRTGQLHAALNPYRQEQGA